MRLANTLLILLLLAVVRPVVAGPSTLVDMRVLIDVSGSMKKNDPQKLRAPALRLLVGMLPDKSRAGVWTFGERVKPVVPVSTVDNHWRKRARRAAYNIHSWEKFTDIEQALVKASADWKPVGESPAGQTRRSIILLTDGIVDISKQQDISDASRKRLLESVLPRLQKLGVKLYTVGLSSGADRDLLEKLATSTGGWYEQVETAGKLDRIFLKLFEQSTQPDTVPLQDNRFNVDDSVRDMTVLVFKDRPDDPIHLQAPDGKRFSNGSHPDNVAWQNEAGYELITVQSPARGDWLIGAKVDPDNRVMVVTNLRLDIDSIPEYLLVGENLVVAAEMAFESKDNERPAFLDKVTMQAVLTASDADNASRTMLHDDGQTPDRKATDYLYSGNVTLEQPGEHQLSVIADGGTFKREVRQSVRVYAEALTLKVDYPASAQSIQLLANAHPALLDPYSLQLELLIAQGGQAATGFERTGGQSWAATLPAGLEGTVVEVRAKGQRLNGTPWSVSKRITLTRDANATAVEPVEPPPEPPGKVVAEEPAPAVEKPDTEVDWLTVGLYVLGANLLLFGIGGGGWWYWKRRQANQTTLEAALEDDGTGTNAAEPPSGPDQTAANEPETETGQTEVPATDSTETSESDLDTGHEPEPAADEEDPETPVDQDPELDISIKPEIDALSEDDTRGPDDTDGTDNLDDKLVDLFESAETDNEPAGADTGSGNDAIPDSEPETETATTAGPEAEPGTETATGTESEAEPGVTAETDPEEIMQQERKAGGI